MVVVLAPRALGERHALARRIALQVLRGRRERRSGLGHLAEHEAEPVDALEPPVTEELAVEGDREQRVVSVRLVARELVPDDRDEVTRVLARAAGRPAGGVLLFLAETEMDRGHAPVAKAAAVVFAMELAVLRIAGITHERRPHLARDAIVPRYRDDAGVADVIRPQQIDVVRGGRRRDREARFVWRKPAELALPGAAHLRHGKPAELAVPAAARDLSGGAGVSG